MLIGHQIKEFRRKKRMTLVELSRRSGVQIATLSRIENMKMVGTLDSHMSIARALEIDFTELYQNAKPPIISEATVASPAPSPSETFTYNKNASYEMLTSNILNKKMMPILLRIDPKGETNPEQNLPESERFIFVIDGEIEAHVGKNKYTLTPSNTLYFNAAEKHFFINTGNSISRLLSITTPVNL